MLTPGNRKLGKHLIWGFGLPSGTVRVCRGMTPSCRRHCYAVRVEQYRPATAARYRANLALSWKKSFARRVRAFSGTARPRCRTSLTLQSPARTANRNSCLWCDGRSRRHTARIASAAVCIGSAGRWLVRSGIG